MDNIRNKSLRNIEEKMQGLEAGSLRYRILENARNFKTSWIALGQALYSVWKDKFYKEWGYATFDAYVLREIGIRKQTAMKLLRSYYFLEKEEPGYLEGGTREEPEKVASLPSYEAVDLLRLAKNKKTLDQHDYASLKKDIFEKGKDPSQVRRDLTAMIRQREELDPEEAHEKKKLATVRRLLGVLKTLKQEAETGKLLPFALIKETAGLINKIEQEIS